MRTKNHKIDNIYVADFETTTELSQTFIQENNVKVILAGIQKLGSMTNRIEMFIDLESFLNYVLTDKDIKLVYFHNLNFDGEFILQYLAKSGFDFTPNSPKLDKVEIFKTGSQIYNFKVLYKKQVTEFRCSYKLLSSSIEMLGKDLKLNKYENVDATNLDDFYKLDPVSNLDELPKNYVEYCKNDIKILNESLTVVNKTLTNNEYVKFYNKNNNYKIDLFSSLTAGSLSQKLIKNIFLPIFNQTHNEEITLNLTPENYDEIKPFLQGGFTQFNPRLISENEDTQIHKGNFKVIDYNSSYPAIMANDLPYGEILRTQPKEKHFTFLTLFVDSVKIKQEHKNLICLKNFTNETDFRYVEQDKNFICCFLEEEYITLQKIYDFKIDKTEKFYMLKRPYLSNFINNFYDLKTYHKNRKEKSLALVYKIILNSSFGKFAAKIDFPTEVFIDGKADEFITVDKKDKRLISEKSKIHYGNFQQKRYVDIKEKTLAPNIAAAVVITALARTRLLEDILKLGSENFLYCDTDSIFYEETETNRGIIKIDDKLGNFDLECEFDEFQTYGAKKYICRKNDVVVKTAISGINLKQFKTENKWDTNKINELLNFNKSTITLEKATLQKTRLEGGILLKNTEKTFRKGVH